MTPILIGLGLLIAFAWLMHRTGQRSYFIYKLIGGGIIILIWMYRDYLLTP